MAQAHQRAGALVLAILFLATSVGTGIAVVYQIMDDEKTANQTLSQTDSSPEAESQIQSTPKEGAMEGTKLEGFEPIEKVESLQKIDTTVGEGEEVKPGATVTAHYTGAIASTGVIFQSSHDRGSPIEFPLDGVIKGWTDGVPGMKVGGKRRLIIPAEQAYGENSPSANIPANSNLVFDIEITAVKNP